MRRTAAFVALVAMTLPIGAQTLPCKGAQMSTDCPAAGCASPGTAEGDANTLRRRHPGVNEPLVTLTIEDFEALQLSANRIGLPGHAIPEGGRTNYRKLRAVRVTTGEGARVQLTGYIVGTPHARRIDGANCRLVGRQNNSFRIHIAELPDDTDFESIIVEMIPQKRRSGWTLPRLRTVAQLKRPVRVIGQLFYDNKHLVNSDPDDEQPGHPRRLSLWEIHPVSDFYVCKYPDDSLCRPSETSDWTTLEEMQNPVPVKDKL